MGDGLALEVTLVKSENVTMGIEFQMGDVVHFVSFRQDLWPGLRVGQFPCRSDGTEWERETIKVFGKARLVESEDEQGQWGANHNYNAAATARALAQLADMFNASAGDENV